MHNVMFIVFLLFYRGVNGDIFANQDNNPWYKEGVKLIKDNLKVKPTQTLPRAQFCFWATEWVSAPSPLHASLMGSRRI